MINCWDNVVLPCSGSSGLRRSTYPLTEFCPCLGKRPIERVRQSPTEAGMFFPFTTYSSMRSLPCLNLGRLLYHTRPLSTSDEMGPLPQLSLLRGSVPLDGIGEIGDRTVNSFSQLLAVCYYVCCG